jgi:hypothetical protein
MRPDRSNYESWFTDWLDGNLNESQIEEIRLFLKENPDLAEELEMMPFLELKPSDLHYPGKESLKKSPASLDGEQFEMMCIASMEGDLGPDESAELNEIIGQDAGKQRIFDLYGRLRLKPGDSRFPRKSVVKRLTIPGRIFRLSPIGISVAAAVATLIIAYVFYRPSPVTGRSLAHTGTANDTLVIGSSPAFKPERTVHVAGSEGKRQSSRRKDIVEAPAQPAAVVAELEDKPDTAAGPASREEPFTVSGADNIAAMKVNLWSRPNDIAGFNPGIMPPTFDPYERRSNVDRLLARFFHEKLMKDRSAGDRPVGSFELAEASIKGLNRLLGWEMLLKQNPSGSEANSYRFTSRLVKVNTPVRKISDIM